MLRLSNRPVTPACDIETIISRFGGLFLEMGEVEIKTQMSQRGTLPLRMSVFKSEKG